jgi:hypothetical protein
MSITWVPIGLKIYPKSHLAISLKSSGLWRWGPKRNQPPHPAPASGTGSDPLLSLPFETSPAPQTAYILRGGGL